VHASRLRTPMCTKRLTRKVFFILFLERRNIFHYVITSVAAENIFLYLSAFCVGEDEMFSLRFLEVNGQIIVTFLKTK